MKGDGRVVAASWQGRTKPHALSRGQDKGLLFKTTSRLANPQPVEG